MDSFSQPVPGVEPSTEDFTEDIKIEEKILEIHKIKSTLNMEATEMTPLPNDTTEQSIDPTMSVPPNEIPVDTDVICSLCQCRLPTLIAAKEHYESRRHQKKYIAAIKEKHEYYTAIAAGKIPMSSPKVAKHTNSAKGTTNTAEGAASNAGDSPEKTNQDGEHDGVLMYCFLCDIQVNSNDQALQHYTGRKHRSRTSLAVTATSSLVTASPKAPGTNEPNLKRKSQVLASSEQQKGDWENKPPVVKKSGGPKATPKPMQKPKPVATTSTPQTFSCTLCGVNVTCKEMLDSHLAGSKHRKVMARLGILNAQQNPTPKKKPGNGMTTFNGRIGNVVRNPNSAPKNAKMMKKANKNPMPAPSNILSINCEVCAVTMNSNTQYQQHLQSARHKGNIQFIRGAQIQHTNKGGPGFNQRKNPRNSQQFGYKQFVKASGGKQKQQNTWSRKKTNQQVPSNNQNWPAVGWQQSGTSIAQGPSSMPNTMDYHQTESYGYQYEQPRPASQGSARFGRQDFKAKSQVTFGQPSSSYMAYTGEMYNA